MQSLQISERVDHAIDFISPGGNPFRSLPKVSKSKINSPQWFAFAELSLGEYSNDVLEYCSSF